MKPDYIISRVYCAENIITTLDVHMWFGNNNQAGNSQNYTRNKVVEMIKAGKSFRTAEPLGNGDGWKLGAEVIHYHEWLKTEPNDEKWDNLEGLPGNCKKPR